MKTIEIDDDAYNILFKKREFLKEYYNPDSTFGDVIRHCKDLSRRDAERSQNNISDRDFGRG